LLLHAELCGTLCTLAARKNVAVEMVGGTMVVVHGVVHPSDTDWDVYLDALRENGDRMTAQLIVTEGGSPNSAQRRASLDIVAGRSFPPSAVITSSVLVRGVVSALSWFMKDRIRAFAPAEFAAACAFIGATKDSETLREVAARLRGTLH
jgi:hypothetical protein